MRVNTASLYVWTSSGLNLLSSALSGSSGHQMMEILKLVDS